MKHLAWILLLIAQTVSAQSFSFRENKQVCFPKTVPPGNYSGITYLGNDKYALVSDKSSSDGFFMFEIKIDTVSGAIKNIKNLGFHDVGSHNSDLEGIAFAKSMNKMYLCSEAKGIVTEYDCEKQALTGRSLDLNVLYPGMQGNGGIESFTYSDRTKTFWTINEMPISIDKSRENDGYLLRLNSIDNNLMPTATYAYRMDKYEKRKNTYIHVVGVSELIATDDGQLLVLEREFFVPKIKVGAYCTCKIYLVNPQKNPNIKNNEIIDNDTVIMHKEKLCEWTTKLSLLGRKIANYEGMCIGPKLTGGRQVVILVADSQNQYRHVLKDWFKSITITPKNK